MCFVTTRPSCTRHLSVVKGQWTNPYRRGSETFLSLHFNFVAGRRNQRLETTGCKSVTAPKKSREESALLGLGKAPVPAFQLGR
jgi:hypothetical protein